MHRCRELWALAIAPDADVTDHGDHLAAVEVRDRWTLPWALQRTAAQYLRSWDETHHSTRCLARTATSFGVLMIFSTIFCMSSP